MKLADFPLRDSWLNVINAIETLENEEHITKNTSAHLFNLLLRFKDLIEDHDEAWEEANKEE